MKNIFLIILLSISVTNWAQSPQGKKSKILKVSYIAYPISTYDTPPPDSKDFAGHEDIVSLAQSYQHYYSLYINLETFESIYKLDTLIVNKKEGQGNMNFMLNSDLRYVIKNKAGNVYKYEKIFDREFYSNGGLDNIKWNITSEVKTISGFKCRKAIATNDGLLLNVWFTEEIPLATGPVIYFGLPGLVVWAEDFFWTTEISKVDYSNELEFSTLMKKVFNSYETNKKGKEITEPLLIIKKNTLVKSMIDQMK